MSRECIESRMGNREGLCKNKEVKDHAKTDTGFDFVVHV